MENSKFEVTGPRGPGSVLSSISPTLVRTLIELRSFSTGDFHMVWDERRISRHRFIEGKDSNGDIEVKQSNIW